MSDPNFLLQTCDERIHVYHDLTILLLDLTFNPARPVKLYRLIQVGFYKQFALTSESELRELVKVAS